MTLILTALTTLTNLQFLTNSDPQTHLSVQNRSSPSRNCGDQSDHSSIHKHSFTLLNWFFCHFWRTSHIQLSIKLETLPTSVNTDLYVRYIYSIKLLQLVRHSQYPSTVWKTYPCVLNYVAVQVGCSEATHVPSRVNIVLYTHVHTFYLSVFGKQARQMGAYMVFSRGVLGRGSDFISSFLFFNWLT